MGDLSRYLNHLTGGRRGETVCRRVAGRYGPHCRFCRFIGWAIRQPEHCCFELDGYPAKD